MKTSWTRRALPAVLACLLAQGAQAQSFEAGRDGLVWSSENGDNELRIGGRIHVDSARFDEDVTPFDDRTDFRRARISVSGRFAKDWRFRIERDVGGTSQGWKGMWLAYRGFDDWDLRAGHLIAPVGMETSMGSDDMPLMERSLSSALSPGFLVGAQATHARKGWTTTLGYYGDPIDTEQDASGQDGRGFAGRATWAPLRRKGRVLHLGASFEQRRVDPVAAPGGFRISSRPGSGLADASLINTGAIAGVDRARTVGIEAGAVLGPVTLLGERMRMTVERAGAPDARFEGGHVTAAWMLTGESRRYNEDTGVIGGIRPARRWGAIELAARWERLDLHDAGITGGSERNLVYGLNWYIGRNVRLMANHVDAEADPNRNGVRESVGIDQVRVQVDF